MRCAEADVAIIAWPTAQDLDRTEWPYAWFSGEAQATRGSQLSHQERHAYCGQCGQRKRCRYDVLRDASFCSETCWLAYTDAHPHHVTTS